MKRQRNTAQMKKQGRNSQDDINKEGLGKLPKKAFRIIIVKMFQSIKNRMDIMQEAINTINTIRLHQQQTSSILPPVPRWDLRILHGTEPSRPPQLPDESHHTGKSVSVVSGSANISCFNNGYYELGCVLQKFIQCFLKPQCVTPECDSI